MSSRSALLHSALLIGCVAFSSAAVVSVPLLNSASPEAPRPRYMHRSSVQLGGNPFAVDPVALATTPPRVPSGALHLPEIGSLALPQVPGLGSFGAATDHLPHVTALALAAEPIATVVVDGVPSPVGVGDRVLADMVVGIDQRGVHLSNGKTLSLEQAVGAAAPPTSLPLPPSPSPTPTPTGGPSPTPVP